LIKVIIKEGEPLEKALKKFKRKVEQSVILKEAKKREVFVKPSIKKKLKIRIANTRNRKRKRKISQKLFI